jgi:hypothetical protein
MFDKLRTSMGLWYAKWQFRKNVDQPRQMTDFLRGARSILVMMPQRYEDAQAAGDSLRRIFQSLKDAHLTVVTTGTRAATIGEMHRSNVIRLDEADLNRFFLPRKNTLKGICGRQYDVVLDLNLDFVLHAAYICKASRAPVRVGIGRPRSDAFFNVEMNLDRSTSPGVVYEKLAQCLEMF